VTGGLGLGVVEGEVEGLGDDVGLGSTVGDGDLSGSVPLSVMAWARVKGVGPLP